MQMGGRLPHLRLIRTAVLVLSLVALAARAGAAPLQEQMAAPLAGKSDPLEEGFRLLYSLRFDDARARFAEDIHSRPDHPLGHSALAASYLFEEFYRQGVLGSEFFLDDERFLGGIKGKPDADRRNRFLGANMRSQQLAGERLMKNQNDADALLVLALAAGMHADYLAVLERRQMASLKYIREAEGHAKRLLAVKPDAYDAYLALGASNYIVGSLPAYKRFFLWFGGIRGQKELGLQQLEKTATGGHYVKPFAKILLALASLREKRPDRARKLLEELAVEFPGNPLYRKELAALDAREKKGASAGSTP
jgi:hypothetical protein